MKAIYFKNKLELVSRFKKKQILDLYEFYLYEMLKKFYHFLRDQKGHELLKKNCNEPKGMLPTVPFHSSQEKRL